MVGNSNLRSDLGEGFPMNAENPNGGQKPRHACKKNESGHPSL